MLKALFNPCHSTSSPEEVGDPQRWASKHLPSPQRGAGTSLYYDAKAATKYISNAFLQALIELIDFSPMRSKGSRFTLGVYRGGGVFARCCPNVRNRSQPSATVHNRSQPLVRRTSGRAYRKGSRRGHFWEWTCRVASFRVAGVALRNMRTW